MKVSQEIADKVKQYQELQSQADKLYKELKEFFEEENGLEGFCTPFIADKPQGARQTDDGEFCDQITLGEDWYKGEYYYPIENSDKYVGCHYEI